MFGIVKPCRHTLTPELREQWRAHLCGQCLSLRDQHGQLARVTTNVDAIVLSVLVEAQQEEPAARAHAAACPLRGMRPASVVAATEPGILHGTAVSLSMASAKVQDHALDGDGMAGRLPRVASGVARRWAAEGEATARRVRFDVGLLHDAVAESNRRERLPEAGFAYHAWPTEEAAGEAFAHTASLGGRPHNAGPLREVGQQFGRITYLLDAFDDQDDDLAHGQFNALVAAFPDPSRRQEAAADLFRHAHAALVRELDAADLPRPALVRALLVDQLRRAGVARFGQAHAATCARAGCATTHGPNGPHGHGHDHRHPHGTRRVRLAGIRRSVAAVTKLGILTGLHLPGFQPGMGAGMNPDIHMEEEMRKRRQEGADGGGGCCDGGGDCCCDVGCCCCCDSCCDGCDCDC